MCVCECVCVCSEEEREKVISKISSRCLRPSKHHLNMCVCVCVCIHKMFSLRWKNKPEVIQIWKVNEATFHCVLTKVNCSKKYFLNKNAQSILFSIILLQNCFIFQWTLEAFSMKLSFHLSFPSDQFACERTRCCKQTAQLDGPHTYKHTHTHTHTHSSAKTIGQSINSGLTRKQFER